MHCLLKLNDCWLTVDLSDAFTLGKCVRLIDVCHILSDLGDQTFGTERLALRVLQATLGKGVPKNEENIVEVETLDKDGKLIQIPIINMIAGVTNTVSTLSLAVVGRLATKVACFPLSPLI